MVLNPDKCSFVLLGVDDELQTNLSNITKDANIKFNALTRVQKYMTTDQKNLIISFFINS